MISELRLATFGVADLERTKRFYAEAFLYEVKGEGAVDTTDPMAARGWALPAGMTARFAVMGPPGLASGLIRLVQFSQAGEQIWRDYSRPGDFGLFAANIRVSKIDEGWARLQAAGARARSQPHTWGENPAVVVHDAMTFDVDDTLLDVFELELRGTSIHKPQTAPASELQNIVIHTEDADRCLAFYAGLGFTVISDRTLKGLADFLKLPPGTDLRNANLAMPELSSNGRIEVSQYVGCPGVRLQDRAVPPRRGILSMGFETDDLQATHRLLGRLGAEWVAGPFDETVPPFGRLRTQVCFGPDGERLNFFQRL